MSSLPIIKDPNPLLRQKAAKIKEITPEIKQLILDMEKTMNEHKGIGLAAPQIGKSIQLCLISTDKGTLALINPLILWKSIRKDTEEEGCLSCPGATIDVKRSKIIYVRALNQNGKFIIFRAKGLFARVIQHEVDHLKGILIIDKNKN
ncbi:MAG: peptide deformylase [Candidatus Buchananbacteria bacterium RBG_13_36_9]|uniref:Peptide deformylase n=1 Tax=Candidatus Buchananbacteria bacterium RBG_13_36_9 TaxID=1797530 RepID=A0A1G1XQS2_9BACT|nr:MAG: peptide deformylase [Candidatus Buchananbacteria bacterium RBG_13_36_9]